MFNKKIRKSAVDQRAPTKRVRLRVHIPKVLRSVLDCQKKKNFVTHHTHTHCIPSHLLSNSLLSFSLTQPVRLFMCMYGEGATELTVVGRSAYEVEVLCVSYIVGVRIHCIRTWRKLVWFF